MKASDQEGSLMPKKGGMEELCWKNCLKCILTVLGQGDGKSLSLAEEISVRPKFPSSHDPHHA
jgi:hypothetical protein